MDVLRKQGILFFCLYVNIRPHLLFAFQTVYFKYILKSLIRVRKNG